MSSVPVLPCKVRAVYSWAKEDPSDLGFVEGDYIDVLDTGDGDWWKGRLKRNKMVGFFPRNYVEYCNKAQRTVPHPDQVARLDISSQCDPGKSTQDILADITMEMNKSWMPTGSSVQDFPDFEEPYEYDEPYQQAYQGDPYDEAYDHLEDDGPDAPPPPPPHLVNSGTTYYSVDESFECPYVNGRPHIETAFHDGQAMITEQGERDLLQPLGNSPVEDEVPFMPSDLKYEKFRAPAATQHRTLSGRSQSFDMGPVTKTKGLVRKLLKGIVDNKELWRSTSMHDLASGTREPRRESLMLPTRPTLPSLPSAGRLKFWQREEEEDEPDASSNAGVSAAAKALLDPHWMGTAQDLYRTKTLSKHELAKRRTRLELEGISVGDPFARLSQDAESYEYYLENFDHVDDFIEQMDSWPALWTPAVLASSKIGRQFADPVHQARGVFMLCALHISYVSSAEGPDGSDAPAALSRVMQQRRATAFELAHVVQSMCNALEIPNKVVRGHFRSQSGESLPHAWNALCIEQEWYLLDASVASPTFPGAHENEINTFYFLTPPHKMIFTHIPNDPQDQFLERPIPTSSAVNLPVAAPGAFRDKVEFVDYWNGLRYMHDLEQCEFVVTLPGSALDVVAEIDPASVGEDLSSSLSGSRGSRGLSSSQHSRAAMPCLALSQPFWQAGKRLFRVKAVLPPTAHKAILNIYTVERHLERRLSNMVLAYSLSLVHKGTAGAAYEFVSRFAHPRAPSQDIYVAEPQCRTLKGGQNYKFCLRSYAVRGPSASNGLLPVRLAVQSPSGRVTKLACAYSEECTEWTAQVRTLEVGCWRGVVCDNADEGWTPFAEWYCT